MSKELRKRKININDIYFSYSYERVTPGKEYYNSISNFHRVYAGLNNQSAKICSKFFQTLLLLLNQNTQQAQPDFYLYCLDLSY